VFSISVVFSQEYIGGARAQVWLSNDQAYAEAARRGNSPVRASMFLEKTIGEIS